MVVVGSIQIHNGFDEYNFCIFNMLLYNLCLFGLMIDMLDNNQMAKINIKILSCIFQNELYRFYVVLAFYLFL
jgi:hypothetical protein